MKKQSPSMESFFQNRHQIKKQLFYALSCFFLISSTLLLFYIGISFDPRSLFHFDLLPLTKTSSSSSRTSTTCDYSDGKWVWDESYQNRYYNETCRFLDPGFRCSQNGRNDEDYRKWRWQPKGCDLPRFNAKDFLERNRNGRIVFAGDSIGRNQWESILCMLGQGVSNESTIYEVNGNPITKHKGFLSMRFYEYNLTVEYYRVPFLVVIGRPPSNSANQTRSTIKVDQLHWYSQHWIGASILVFNGGHWWNEDKTVKMGCHFEEGGKVNTSMDVMEGFRRSLQTWKSWAEDNLDPDKTRIFFRSYSPVHFSGGTWKDGGTCDMDKEPEINYETKMGPEPENNVFISDVVKQMGNGERKVQFLNITYLTEFRSDGHPSKYREPGTPVPTPQDCSHWCLPGVPDTWNELLHAYILSNGFKRK